MNRCKKHNIIKRAILFLLALGFALSPLDVLATSSSSSSQSSGMSSDYEISVDRSDGEEKYLCSGKDINNNYLHIYGVQFHNHTNNTTEAIGITGMVENKADFDIYFTLNNSYYDAKDNLILSSINMHVAPAGKTVKFVSMENSEDFIVYSYDTRIKKVEVPTHFSVEIDSMALSYSEDQGKFASEEYTGTDFVYDSYDINVIVGEDESMKIVEKADAVFASPKQGIIRHLPMRWDTDTISGTRRMNVENINVNETFEVSKNFSDRELNVKIGNAGTYITGLKHYEISYTYKIDKENESDFDEFYLDLFQDTHNTSNISFTITMPKEFDASRIGFSTGYSGSSKNENIIYYVEGNSVHGQYAGILKNGNITMRLALEDGYYSNPGLPTPEPGKLIKIAIYIPVIMLLIVFIFWYLFGRDEKHVSAVEFYPPDGMNSLDMQFYYKGEVDSDGVVSLLTYLASKGYLKIEQDGRKFAVIKVKDYDGTNDDEKYFMERLFADGRDYVTSSMLRNKFYRTVNSIVRDNNKKASKNLIFEKKPKGVNFACILCVIVTFISTIIAFAVDVQNEDILAMLAVFSLLCLIYGPMYVAAFSVKGAAKFIVLGFIIFHSGIMISAFVFGSGVLELFDEVNPIYLAACVEAVVCVIIEIILITLLPKRNQHGAQMLARIEGFRNFLMTAERSRLEMLMAEDPTYFYNIIPYAYVLGVSKKWMRQFEDIAISAPDWYVSDQPFSYRNFRSFMDTTVSKASSAMTTSPSSSGGGGSSGGSSGGGSSGGGGGGGGSSSW